VVLQVEDEIRELVATHAGLAISEATLAGDGRSFEEIGAARSASDDAPPRPHSGPADGQSQATSVTRGGETVSASEGDREARGVQTAVASERGDVR